MKKVLFIASECAPFVKTGGLADVTGTLPKYFDKDKYEVRVIIPNYKCIKPEWKERMNFVTNVYMDMADEFDISFGDETITDSVMRREITINYKTQSKEAAEYIAQLIEDSRNTYLITGYNTSCDEQNTQWSSTLSLVNYEYVTKKQEAALNARKNPGSSNAKTADDQTSVLESLAGEVSK